MFLQNVFFPLKVNTTNCFGKIKCIVIIYISSDSSAWVLDTQVDGNDFSSLVVTEKSEKVSSILCETGKCPKKIRFELLVIKLTEWKHLYGHLDHF